MSIDPISIGISLALSAASVAMQSLRRIEGPRLEDTKFNAADYGGLFTRFWGKRWIVPKVMFGEDLRHEEVESKTKGGKYNQHKYYGTWAVMIAPHPIDAVLRVKMDGHLVFDLTGAGPVVPFDLGDGAKSYSLDQWLEDHPASSIMPSIGGKGTAYFAIYTGTPGQEADERMLATVEALNGVGSCPDYRGRSYLVLKELPLEKFGNRIPQIEIEAVTAGEQRYPLETFPTTTAQPHRLWGATFSNDYSRFLWSDGTEYEIWDVAARARMVAGTWPRETALTSRYGLSRNGSIYAVGPPIDGPYLFTDLLLFSADGTSVAAAPNAFPGISFDQRYQQEVRVLEDASGVEHWLTIPWSTVRYFYVDVISDGLAAGLTDDKTMLKLTGVDWSPCEWFSDGDGGIWAVGREPSLGTTAAYFYRMIGGGDTPEFVAVGGLPPATSALGNCTACYYGGAFILFWNNGTDGKVYRVDPTTGAILTTRTLTLDVYNTAKQVANLAPAASSIWLDEQEISLADLTTIRTIDGTDWNATDLHGIIYDPTNHALWTAPQFDQELNILHLDRVGGTALTLRTVVEDVCELAGIDLATVDASALTQEVLGHSVAGGTGKDWLEPLLDLHDVDPRPHGFKLQFVNRGAAPSVTLTSSIDFAAPEDGESPFAHVRPGATDVPAYLALQFADPAIDQQRNSTLSGPRGKADGVKPLNIDMTTLAIVADDAQQLGMRLHRRMAFDAGGVSLALPSKQIALEPADVRTLSLRGQAVKARLVSIEMRADRRFATDWKRDDPSVALLAGAEGAAADGNTPGVILIPRISKGFAIDAPLLADIDSQVSPALYVLAAPYSSGPWPGAAMFQAVDGEYTDQLASIDASASAAWGTVTELAYANPNVWDRGSAITVTLQTGELTGTTEAACDANPRLNQAAIGAPGRWEYVQFTGATLTAPNTYTVSGFKRGRRGTEWAAELHQVGDQFVLLGTAAAATLGLSEVGTDLSFKVATNGRSASGAFPLDVAPFTGASLKPYAPCHLCARKEANGDWKLTWVRRTRVGGAWTSGTSIPLSEASEEYTVTVGDGVDESTATVASATYTWPLAAQTTLTGGEVLTGDLVFSVAQVSDAVGAGFLAEATA